MWGIFSDIWTCIIPLYGLLDLNQHMFLYYIIGMSPATHDSRKLMGVLWCLVMLIKRVNLSAWLHVKQGFRQGRKLTSFSLVALRTYSASQEDFHCVYCVVFCRGLILVNLCIPFRVVSLALKQPMMTSSNGSFFRVTGPLCGEFTGHRWVPFIKGQ